MSFGPVWCENAGPSLRPVLVLLPSKGLRVWHVKFERAEHRVDTGVGGLNPPGSGEPWLPSESVTRAGSVDVPSSGEFSGVAGGNYVPLHLRHLLECLSLHQLRQAWPIQCQGMNICHIRAVQSL